MRAFCFCIPDPHAAAIRVGHAPLVGTAGRSRGEAAAMEVSTLDDPAKNGVGSPPPG